jgi:hypothetical protein
MEENNFEEDHSSNFIRIDNRTKISLMVSILLDTAEENKQKAMKEAISLAFDIDRSVGDELRRRKEMKKRARLSQNGIVRSSYGSK